MTEREIHVWMPALRVGTGADVFTERLASELRKVGIAVTIDWLDARYELFPWLLAHTTRPPRGANVIHANAAYAFAFHRFGLPLVATEHHYVMDPAYAPYRSVAQAAYHKLWLSRWIYRSFRMAEVLTTVSEFTAAAIRSKHPGQNVRVISPWVDTTTFTPPANVARDAKPLRILFAGNGSRRKGADVLPELARVLGEDFEIWATAGLRDIAGGVVASNIRPLGRLSAEDLIATFKACDVVLVPSRYEGFGYVALEAMACAKPVVGFSCGAVDEVVGADAAFLVRIDDVEAMAEKLRMLAANPEMREDMGRLGRQRAITRFGVDQSVDAYVGLYEELLMGRTS